MLLSGCSPVLRIARICVHWPTYYSLRIPHIMALHGSSQYLNHSIQTQQSAQIFAQGWHIPNITWYMALLDTWAISISQWINTNPRVCTNLCTRSTHSKHHVIHGTAWYMALLEPSHAQALQSTCNLRGAHQLNCMWARLKNKRSHLSNSFKPCIFNQPLTTIRTGTFIQQGTRQFTLSRVHSRYAEVWPIRSWDKASGKSKVGQEKAVVPTGCVANLQKPHHFVHGDDQGPQQSSRNAHQCKNEQFPVQRIEAHNKIMRGMREHLLVQCTKAHRSDYVWVWVYMCVRAHSKSEPVSVPSNERTASLNAQGKSWNNQRSRQDIHSVTESAWVRVREYGDAWWRCVMRCEGSAWVWVFEYGDACFK